MTRKCVPSIRLRHGRTLQALWLAAALIVPVSVIVTPPDAKSAEPAAESFVRTNLETGLSILNDHTLGEAERGEKLRGQLDSIIDSRGVAMFSLGFARRSATPKQIEQFVEVFRNYLLAYYASILTKYYKGQVVQITRCVEVDPQTYIVSAVLVNPAEANQKQFQPIEMDFRVNRDNGHFYITDFAVARMWFGIQQRDRIRSFLLETGNFSGLIVRLRVLTGLKQLLN